MLRVDVALPVLAAALVIALAAVELRSAGRASPCCGLLCSATHRREPDAGRLADDTVIDGCVRRRR
jgi:hypothetical protein